MVDRKTKLPADPRVAKIIHDIMNDGTSLRFITEIMERAAGEMGAKEAQEFASKMCSEMYLRLTGKEFDGAWPGDETLK